MTQRIRRLNRLIVQGLPDQEAIKNGISSGATRRTRSHSANARTRGSGLRAGRPRRPL